MKRALLACAIGVVLACSGARLETMSAESPATGPAGASGSGGTGGNGTSGAGGTLGGTTPEGARETPGGPAGRTAPRYPLLDGG